MRALVIAILLLGAGPGCDAPSDAPGEGGTHAPDSGPSPDQGVAGSQARLGVVVIDVQDLFVRYAAQKEIDQIIDNIRSTLALTAQHRTPLFVTFEDSKNRSTGHGLPARLAGAIPAHAREFIKTTFAATGNKAFASAVRQSGLTHLVVLGAETDVCVLQTALGLRAMGFEVILQQDAVFTSEPNTAPALRRMRQAGVRMASASEVQALAAGKAPLPAAEGGTIAIVKPLSIAVVLNRFDDAGLAGSSDPLGVAKHARLRELLLISEWFDMPLYGAGSHTLPAKYGSLITKQIQPLESLASAAGIEQIVIAGTDAGLAGLVQGLAKARDVFLVEDALLSSGAGDQPSTLEALYNDASAVPITYKSLYYGMTKSISLAEWPSKSWVDKDPVYYPKTRAPEDLPPMAD